MEYLLHILILSALYVTVAVSFNLIAGHGGFLAICQAGFFGIGAYTSAILATRAGMPFYAGLFAGMGLAILASFVVSLPSLRLHDDYFVIATFGFGMIFLGILNNWMNLTRGPLGIPGIPKPLLFGWRVDSHWEFLGVSFFLACVTQLSVSRLSSSPFGRVLHAIREDEVFAAMPGKNTLYFKVAAFAFSAALAAAAGSLYAHYITYIDPSSFTIMESILVVSMVIVGGAGSKWGPVVGAVALVFLPELLRFVGLPSNLAANVRQILYGGTLLACMLWRPQGLLGDLTFGKDNSR